MATALALSSFGCGGTSQSGASSPPKAEFIEEANALCREAEKALQAGIRAELAGNEPKNAAAATKAEAEIGRTVLIPAKQNQAKQLRDLGAPDGDESQVSAIVDALEQGIRKAERRPERAVKDGTEAFGKANRLAREYGLSC